MTFAQCTWLNEPAVWRRDGDALKVTTDRSTDFWRETYYGVTRDTGHFFGFETAGDFTAEMRIQAQYRELYDQAGLMVRLSDDEWVKAGIELSDGKPMASSVLTQTGRRLRIVATRPIFGCGSPSKRAPCASSCPATGSSGR